MLNLDRLRPVLDIERVQQAVVAIVGAGGSAGLAGDLARCGVQQFVLVDFDIVEAANIARQGHRADQVGRRKVDAVAELIHGINPLAQVTGLGCDVTTLTQAEQDFHFADVDLFLFCTDRFAAQAFSNTLALRRNTPAIWPGLYRGARAGEIVFWHPDLKACFRCLCQSRYQAHARATGPALDPPSDGSDVFAIHLLDSIVGQLALGLLTRGASNRFGRLVEQLGDRNFLQVKLDPTWTLRGRDVIREQLGVAEECDTLFSWVTIARRDPLGGEPPCPDCVRFRQRSAVIGVEQEVA